MSKAKKDSTGSQNSEQEGPNRRSALLLSAALGAGAAVGFAEKTKADESSPEWHNGMEVTTPPSLVVQTKYGKVRGYARGGILIFKGMPYGADTGGENRWLAPKPPAPWNGVRPTMSNGPMSPQNNAAQAWITNPEKAFVQDWDPGFDGEGGHRSEDMLRLNVWTQSVSGKRPVMVWIHGGGFSAGSSHELAYYDGENTARGGLVMVSVNHRLNVLGLLDVSKIGGETYRDSANVSMLDLVAALEWVRDNIANFGGDPHNVTIVGQSGGGSKVTTLMGMPSAAGLFHRASVQSGGGINMPDSAASQAYAAQIMIELGLAPHDIAGLRKIDWARINTAADAAAFKINGPLRGPSGPGAVPGKPQVGNGPTMDGRIIPSRPFFDSAPAISKNIPMMIGSVREEASNLASNPLEEEWRRTLVSDYGAAKAAALIPALKAARPTETIAKLSYGVQGLTQRNNVQRMAKHKYDQGGAPVYQYWFVRQTPVLDGRPGSYHCSELPFCFNNVSRAEQGTGATAKAYALAKKMSQAWINFAKTGNPSQPGLPWAAYDPAHVQTMVWDDDNSRVMNDPDGAVRKILLD